MSSSLSAGRESEGQQPGPGTKGCCTRVSECFPCPRGFEPSTHSFTLQKEYLCLVAYSFQDETQMLANVGFKAHIFFVTCVAFQHLTTRYQLYKAGYSQMWAQRAAKETCPRCSSGVGAVSLPARTGGEEKGMRWLWSLHPLPCKFLGCMT